MARRVVSVLLASVAALACSNGPSSPPPPKQEAPAPPRPTPTVRLERETTIRESGAVALARIDGSRRALVADEDDGAIVEIDLDEKKLVSATSIGTRPRDLLVLADGSVAVTLPDAAAVAVFTRDDGGAYHEVRRAATGAEPLAMALDPTDATLYVTTGASHSLVALSSASLEQAMRVTLAREPRAVLVSGDGERVFTTHAADTVVSVVPAVGKVGEPVTRDIGNREMCRGRTSCSGRRIARNAAAIVRVGERGVVVPASQSLPVPPGIVSKRSCFPRVGAGAGRSRSGRPEGYGASDNEAGPPVVGDLETLDATTGAFFGVGMASLGGPSCLLPRAAIALGNEILVACLGSAIITRTKGRTFDFGAVRAEDPQPWRDGAWNANASVVAVSVPRGPSGIAVDRERASIVVWSSYARALTRIDSATMKDRTTIDVPRNVPREDAWLRGRELFFTNGDKRISADGRACASCHVDGRDDGAAWQTADGKRRTRLLSGEIGAGPYGWRGEHATLEDHVHATFVQLGGKGLPDDELASLVVYLRSLPKLQASRAGDAAAERGRDVFASANCGSCHANGASDRVVHDVGTGGNFMTPTLTGVATRGQLMHDGRFDDLEALLVGSPDMGRANLLSVDDRRALVRYLETL